MIWKQKVIDEQYGGDVQRFETAFAESMAESNVSVIYWDDLIVEATTLTHVKEKGRELIEINLGYLPPQEVMMPYEPYLRALIQGYWQNTIPEGDFLMQLEDHIKLIRKADMKHNTCLAYDEAIYRNYHKTFTPYGYAVKDRLAKFLGYVPQLEHSLIAEMWMRDIMSDETYRLPEDMTPDDIRAMTLIKYREVLLMQGPAAANESPLISHSP